MSRLTERESVTAVTSFSYFLLIVSVSQICTQVDPHFICLNVSIMVMNVFFRSVVLTALLQFACATKWKTLDYLYEMTEQGTAVAGVHNKLSQTPASFTNEVTGIAGKAPGLWSGDFLFDYNIQHRWAMVHEAKKQFQSGAIVNIMWHACSPTASEPCDWNQAVCKKDALSASQWNELITDGTPINKVWKQRMDDIAKYLVFLRDEGVEVMFRPFHEMNHPSCFWWAGRKGSNGSKRLYQITHDYLTNTKGLSNLIWNWNVQDFGSLATDVVDFNPGSQYWDVVSLDVYGSDGSRYSQAKYDIMKNVAGTKPMAIGECDVLPKLSELASQPRWVFFMSWSELTTQSNSNQAIQTLYNGNQVITLNEMPGWKTTTPPGTKKFYRSFHGTYLSAWNDRTIKLQAKPQGWEEWTTVPAGNGKVLLRSFHGNYLSAWPDAHVELIAQAQAWEMWTVVQNTDGSVSFLSHHGTYLSAWPDGRVRLMPHNQGWEHWF